MKKPAALVLVYALFFLFFIQMAGTLIQSIYVLDLMNTSLDEKALGVLFFFTPALLLLFRKKWPAWVHWALFGGFILARLITPSLGTSARLFSTGMAVGLGLLVMPFLFSARMKGTTENPLGFTASTGLALAVALSIFLRTINFSVDYSLTSAGAWAGWVLCLLLALASVGLEWTEAGAVEKNGGSITGPVLGIFMVLTLVYFVFSAPAVIARWTEGNYPLIVTLVSLLSGGWLLVSFRFPDLIERISTGWVRVWNILFGLKFGRHDPGSPGRVPVHAGFGGSGSRRAELVPANSLVHHVAAFPGHLRGLAPVLPAHPAGATDPASIHPGLAAGEPGAGCARFHLHLYQCVGLHRPGQYTLPEYVLATIPADHWRSQPADLAGVLPGGGGRVPGWL